MTWGEFQIEKELYKLAWGQMKRPFSGAMQDFLKKSKLVVSCGREFDIDSDFPAVLELCHAFFPYDPGTISPLTDPEFLKISKGWRVQIRFPYVDIDFIQELKLSPYCDKENTPMRASSSDVVILKDPVRADFSGSFQQQGL